MGGKKDRFGLMPQVETVMFSATETADDANYSITAELERFERRTSHEQCLKQRGSWTLRQVRAGRCLA